MKYEVTRSHIKIYGNGDLKILRLNISYN